ncbi:MAG TPA: hypothetical protein PKY99_00210 [Turneriella sp.]|nr:hypothetical protein [Turneriella sp.]
MVYVGLGRWLKPDVSYEDILTVCDLIRVAQDKKLFTRIIYYKKVVEIMTTGSGLFGRRIRWYHYRLIVRVLKAADMMSDEKVEYDPRETLMDFVNWLAPRLGKTPKEILLQFNSATLFDYYSSAISFLYQKEMAKALAQHAPLKYHEIISGLYEYKAQARRSALESRQKEIDETEESPDTQPLIADLGSAFDGGFHG